MTPRLTRAIEPLDLPAKLAAAERRAQQRDALVEAARNYRKADMADRRGLDAKTLSALREAEIALTAAALAMED